MSPTSPLSAPSGVWWALALALAALALVPLASAWDAAPDLGHGWAAPLLIAYLLWERWPERPCVSPRPSPATAVWLWLAASLVLPLAATLRLVLTPFPLWPVPLIAYTGLLASVVLASAAFLAGRPGCRWVGGPLLLLLATLPWPTTVDSLFIAPLRVGLASIAAELCYIFGVSALAQGTTLRLAEAWVGVDETCGGMRSLQAAFLAAVFLGEWLRLSWSRRLLLVFLGGLAAVLGNFLRILLLVWRASVGGKEALDAVHDLAGWLSLAVSLLLTGLAARLLGRATAPAPPPAAKSFRPLLPRAPAALVFLVAGLALSELGTRAWYAHGASRRAEEFPQWIAVFPTQAPGYQDLPLADAAAEILGPDYYAAAEWQATDRHTANAYYIEWREGQAARSIPFLHNPTVCLPLSGCEHVRTSGTIHIPGPAGDIPFSVHVFRRLGEEFAVAFALWDPARGRPLEKIAPGRDGWLAAQFADIREARADQPAQLLTLALWGPDAEASLPAVLARLIIPLPRSSTPTTPSDAISTGLR